MNARQLTARLKGKWHDGKAFGLAACPAHDDASPSLSIGTGDDGRTLVHCLAGCSQERVIAALRGRKLWDGNSDVTLDPAEQEREKQKREAEEAKRSAAALKIWRETEPADGTLVETYLRFRGIKIPVPPTLRYLRGAKHGPTGLIFGAMVAAISGLDRRLSAVHRTYLNAHGSGKASVNSPKMALGPIGTGSVHLAAAGAELGIAEGIETGLSAMQLFGIPVWCACGSWLERVAVPAPVSTVIIFADNGMPGELAAEKAAKVHHDAGRVVDVRFPPAGDWNDALRTRGGERAA